MIYDEREAFSISTKDSLNILINLDCVDFAYINDDLFRRTIFHSSSNLSNKESKKINNKLLTDQLANKDSSDSVNSNQSWNHTNEKFTRYGGIEQQRMCDEVKLMFNLKYNYDVTEL